MTDETNWSKRILGVRDRVEQARTRYWQLEQRPGRTGEEIRGEFQSALMQYYDVLREFRTNNKISSEWEESGVEELRRLTTEKVKVEVEQTGLGASTKTVKKPKIDEIPMTRLVELSYKLDDFANELGFTAEVEEDLPEYIIE